GTPPASSTQVRTQPIRALWDVLMVRTTLLLSLTLITALVTAGVPARAATLAKVKHRWSESAPKKAHRSAAVDLKEARRTGVLKAAARAGLGTRATQN